MKVPAIAKIIGLAAFSVATLASTGVVSLLILAFALGLAMLLLGASPSRTGRALLPALPFIAIITAFQWLISGIDPAVISCLRMLLLYLAGSIITITTSEAEFSGAIRQVLRPVSRITRTNVDRDLATMMTLTIAFIPIIAEEHDAIKLAQEARGVSFEGIAGTIKGEITTLIPLLYAIAARADRIALAMEARCYGINR